MQKKARAVAGYQWANLSIAGREAWCLIGNEWAGVILHWPHVGPGAYNASIPFIRLVTVCTEPARLTVLTRQLPARPLIKQANHHANK